MDLEAARDPEAAPGCRVVAECRADVLRSNYLAIRDLNPGLSLIPMVKANAYGHGAAWAARVLADQPDLYGLGVATLAEGRDLRKALGVKGRKVPILVFSGAMPWTEERGRFCEAHHLTPVLASDDAWDAFHREGWTARLRYEIKFNTGMNRLGLSMDRLDRVRAQLQKLPADQKPQGVLSHLARAEEPENPRTREQVERFRKIRQTLDSVLPSSFFHLANSSAIWNFRKLGLHGWTDVVRPGISLYGVAPWAGAPARGVSPVLELRATVLQVRTVAPGEGIGYGFTHTVSKGRQAASERVAILGCGYADGLPRFLSNRGRAVLRSRDETFRGIISMDLSAVSCGADVVPGDTATLLGPGVDIWEQSKLAGTVPYELLTSLGTRVERIHG